MRPATVGPAEAGIPPARFAYKWIALSNTTIGMLMATVNATSILIAMPVIFRGININPLDPANFSYLLWLLMGYMVVSAVLVVTAGRLGDMFGRTRVYNIGFAVFTIAAVGLSLVWSQGAAGAIELIILRMVQAIGGAMVMASGAAIITDAFPSDQRGLALGINMIAGMAGSFLGILVGGVLATINWRWIFMINVPIGLIGSVWGFWQLREIGVRHRARIDWIGNVTFAAGLAMVLIGVTSGLQPYGGSAMGWGNPSVIGLVAGGLLILAFFAFWETRTKDPLFHLELFRIRAFTLGNIAGLLGAVSRGGLQFMLIIWLQGIWLPLHGYDYTQTPLWAGIYMLPMTIGFLVAGPISGMLSDRYGARPFATGGMLLSALTFGLLMLLPADFWFPVFALLIFLNGVAMGLFASPNTAAIMNSVPGPHRQRRAGGGGASPGRAAADQLPLRVVPRLQPAADAARPGAWTAGARRCGPADGKHLLPVVDLRPVPARTGARVELLDRGEPRRRPGLSASRRPLRPRGDSHDAAPGGGRFVGERQQNTSKI